MQLFEGCAAVKIEDFDVCSPPPGDIGAICDSFIAPNERILSQSEWSALKSKWIDEGKAIECTTSDAIGSIKAEIEKLCSLTKCDYATQKKIVDGLTRVESLGRTRLGAPKP